VCVCVCVCERCVDYLVTFHFGYSKEEEDEGEEVFMITCTCHRSSIYMPSCLLPVVKRCVRGGYYNTLVDSLFFTSTQVVNPLVTHIVMNLCVNTRFVYIQQHLFFSQLVLSLYLVLAEALKTEFTLAGKKNSN